MQSMNQDMDTPNKQKKIQKIQKEKKNNSHQQQKNRKKNREREQQQTELNDSRSTLKEKEYDILVKVPNSSKKGQRSFRVDILAENIEQKLNDFCKGQHLDSEVALHLKVYILQNIILDDNEDNNVLN